MEFLTGAAQKEVERYSNLEITLCKFGDPSCDALMLGLLTRAFSEIKVFPDASAITLQSVEEVYFNLLEIEFPAYISVNTTGCCKTPEAILRFSGGGAIIALPSRPRPPPTCVNCKNRYQAGKRADVNHAERCLPLTRLNKNFHDIIAEIAGLEYSQFVRKDSEGKQVKSEGKVVEDLRVRNRTPKIPNV